MTDPAIETSMRQISAAVPTLPAAELSELSRWASALLTKIDARRPVQKPQWRIDMEEGLKPEGGSDPF
jgi:hypothetical protein